MKAKLVVYFTFILISVGFSIHSSAAIIYPKEPDGGREMVLEYLNHLDVKSFPSFKDVKPTNDLDFSRPVVNYDTGYLARGHLLVGATPQEWNYITMRGTNFIGTAGLAADRKTGRAIHCISFSDGDWNKEVAKALRLAEQSPQVQDQDYEPRLLDDLLISFHAIWLHGQSNDLIIPLSSMDNRLNAYQLYSEKQIIQILKPVAKREAAIQTKIYQQREKDNDTCAKAMTDYEKAHGGKCGAISYDGEDSPYQMIEPNVEFITLLGMSSNCGKVSYKVKITYAGHFEGIKNVEILEKLK